MALPSYDHMYERSFWDRPDRISPNRNDRGSGKTKRGWYWGNNPINPNLGRVGPQNPGAASFGQPVGASAPTPAPRPAATSFGSPVGTTPSGPAASVGNTRPATSSTPAYAQTQATANSVSAPTNPPAPQSAQAQTTTTPVTVPTIPQDPGYQGPVTPPQVSNDHPFFDPNSNYAKEGWLFERFPGMGDAGNNTFNMWAEANPEAYYYGVMNQRGLGGYDARSQMAQGMFRDAMRAYGAAKMQNAGLRWPQFMSMWDPEDALALLSNEQLGIDESRFAGRDRWGLRGAR